MLLPAILLSDATDDFLEHCRTEKGLTRRTILTYGAALRQYRKWLQASGCEAPTLADFDSPLIKKYHYQAAGQGLRPRSLRGKLVPLRSLGTWALAHGLLQENPALVVKLPRLDAAKRNVTSDDEVRALLTAAERLPNLRRSALAKAMLSVLVYGALRRQELLDMRIADINLKDGSVTIRSGKGQKPRIVWPHRECLIALREWLAVRPKAEQDWLWPFDKTRRFHYNGLRSILEEVKAVAGLRDHSNIHPHSLRRNCATRLMQQGADLRSIQQFLGHAELTTTAVYLATDEQRLRQMSKLGSLTPRTSAEPNRSGNEQDQGSGRASTKAACGKQGEYQREYQPESRATFSRLKRASSR